MQGVKQALKPPTSGERMSFGVARHNHSNGSCIVTSGQLQRVTSGVIKSHIHRYVLHTKLKCKSSKYK